LPLEIYSINFEALRQLGKMVVLGLGTASTEREIGLGTASTERNEYTHSIWLHFLITCKVSYRNSKSVSNLVELKTLQASSTHPMKALHLCPLDHKMLSPMIQKAQRINKICQESMEKQNNHKQEDSSAWRHEIFFIFLFFF